MTQVAFAKKPNIILVLTDDQGWTDTSVQMIAGRPDTASPFYQTPNLQRMANRGMVFSDAYSPAPTCTPSRCSIQFGKTPARLRQTVVHDVLAKQRGIDCHDEISIAQMVKANDPHYVTGHFGKWGFPPRKPEHAGYDESDGNTNNAHGDYLDVKQHTPLPADDPKRIFSVTKRANEFISKQTKAGRPFFLQISHYAAHVDSQAKPATLNKTRGRAPSGRFEQADFGPPTPGKDELLYPAMIEDLDTGLGLMLDHLQTLGITERTYVIFTSDNGGGFRGNAPLSGGKANAWEGGLRVPMVVIGPQVLRGSHCKTPVAGWDFWATIHDLTSGGKTLPADIDGVSLLSAFEKGNAGELNRVDESLVFHFPWYSGVPMSTIRQGDYKLVRCLNSGEARLFDLSNDMGEKNNLAATMPVKAKQLDALLTTYLRKVKAETIDDMRAARRSELAGYLKRDDENMTKCRQQLKNATGSEREELLEKLSIAQKNKARHHQGLEQLKQGELTTPW